MAIEWTGIKRANEETAAHDDITPVANSGAPGDVVVGDSTVFIKTSMYGDKWLSRFDTLPEYNDPFKRGYIPYSKSQTDNPVVSRFLFANETAAESPVLNFSDGYKRAVTAASSSSSGYASGGFDIDLGSKVSSIRKLNFSVESDLLVIASLTSGVYQATGPCSSLKGYRCGGMDNSGLTSTCDYINFANDASNAIAIQNADKPFEVAAAYNTTTKGYLLGAVCYKAGGGYESVSTIRKLGFANDTISVISETTQRATYSLSTANSTIRGYIVRGYEYNVGYIDYYFRFVFSSETTVINALGQYVPSRINGTTNSNVACYIHGGSRRGKMFFGSDTQADVCAYYTENPEVPRSFMALDTTDNNGYIFPN